MLFVLRFTAFEEYFSVQFNNKFDRFNKTCKHRFDRVHLSVRLSRSRTNPFRNRSSSFSVGLPRSAYAIVSIVSVFITKILASHISHQQLSKFQQLDQRQEKKEPAMAYEGIQISTLQVRQACREVLRNNCNID